MKSYYCIDASRHRFLLLGESCLTRRFVLAFVLAAIAFGMCFNFGAKTAGAYPLDAHERTGIERLQGYYFALHTPRGKQNIVPGARLKSSEITLGLLGKTFYLPAKPDVNYSTRIKNMLGKNASRYGIAVLDITNPQDILFAAHNENAVFTPGSVGKIVVALAVMQKLADIYPNDIAMRERILRETKIVADDFILSDTHDVPFWNLEEGRLSFRPLAVGDSANLWSYLDYMLSASSNAAGSTVMKQLILLSHYGRSYPPSLEEERRFFATTKKNALGDMLRRTLDEAVKRNGLLTGALAQGSMFTRQGRNKVPNVGSRASARELVKFLLLLEQGKLVDEFSSAELKRLLYMTQKRIRYAASPYLENAAIYFKSGSLYSCRPEKGFICKKYGGNVENTLNSLAIIEYPAKDIRYHYLVAVNSNVLRESSVRLHKTLAAKIQKLIEMRHAMRE